MYLEKRDKHLNLAKYVNVIYFVLMVKAVCGSSRTHGLEGGKIPQGIYLSLQLRDEVVKRGIVPQISARTVGRLLKSGGIKTPPNRKLGPTPYHGYRDLQPTGW